MKNAFILILLIKILTSCELTDVVNQDPPNNLVPENVVRNEEDAEALLNGIYSLIISSKNSHYYMSTELFPGALSGSMGSIGSGSTDFLANNLQFDDNNIRLFWEILYKVIDAANNTVYLTQELSKEEFTRFNQKEIIGESYFLRAMATFDVLRYFGQFYDLDSAYGVIIRTDPVNFVSRNVHRSTVAETYEQILNDLDYAIEHAPDFKVSYRASKTSAKALKARVMLYMANYSEAVRLADEVINEKTRDLESDFTSVFDKGLNSSEMILMTYRHPNSDEEENNRKRVYPGRVGDTWLPEIMENDPREQYTYEGLNILKTNNVATYRPTYFIRLSEIYLIKAEALMYEKATIEEVLEPLNRIRNRVGLENSEASTREQVKESIFNEIVRELVFENGGEWFAAIRFDKIKELKPTIESSNQYILPIPEEEIFGNSKIDLSDQNPGY